ncbi:MAG: hypothetical protein AABW72_03615 [archaeon]
MNPNIGIRKRPRKREVKVVFGSRRQFSSARLSEFERKYAADARALVKKIGAMPLEEIAKLPEQRRLVTLGIKKGNYITEPLTFTQALAILPLTKIQRYTILSERASITGFRGSDAKTIVRNWGRMVRTAQEILANIGSQNT